MMEDPLMIEEPLKMEDPLMVEDPLEMDEIQGILEDEDHQVHQDLPGPVRPIIVQQPQVTLDTTALENTFGTVDQSMLQLARAQDQTNRHLQQHLQQGQQNLQAHTGALQHLATSTCINATLIIFLPAYPYMMEATEKVSFRDWNAWKLPASIVEGISRLKTLGRSAGPVQNVIMALLIAHS